MGLVGPSGSGKSTLVSLMPRFYDPNAGSVTIDGIDVRDISIRSLRRQIGFVLQDTQLFYATIWQNIAYGQPDATRDEIVARRDAGAGARRSSRRCPMATTRWLGRAGCTLSGGQRQRLGIARAMVRDASILIMDEPSSGLDAESERLVFEGLDHLLEGKTTFVIAHRLATMRKADVILVLDKGRIVERGTHDELAASHGLYSELLRSQSPEDVRAGEVLGSKASHI